MNVLLASFFNLYRFPPGRREYVFRQVRQIASDADWTALVELCERAIRHEDLRRNRRRELVAVMNEPANPELSALDPQIDRLVGALGRLASEPIAAMPKSRKAAAGRIILRRALPAGAATVTTRDYTDQAAEVASIVALLRGALAAEVEELQLEDYVAELERLNTQFTTALHDRPRGRVTSDEIRRLDEEGQDNLLQLVVVVFNRFIDRSAADLEGRARFLTPLLEQNRAIYDYLRARRRVYDVDPATGAEVVTTEDDAAEVGAPAAGTTPPAPVD